MDAEDIVRASREIDKSDWGDGPWQEEPDEVSWSFGDVPCRIVRHPRDGYLNGYVAIPPSHPWYEIPDQDIDLTLDRDAVQHRLSYSGRFDASTFASATDEALWWVGFDCDHITDAAPGRDAYERSRGREPLNLVKQTYCDTGYVRAEVERLAVQAIRAMVRA